MSYRNAVQFILLNEDDEFLVIHPTGWDLNNWKFPSGGVEEGESHEDALKREVFEELQVTDKDYEIIFSLPKSGRYEWGEDAIKYYNGKYRGQQLHSFILRVKNDVKLVPDPVEINTYKWVKKGEFDKYFVFPGQMDHIKRILELFHF